MAPTHSIPPKLPRIVRLILTNWIIGFAMAALFTGALIGLNVGQIGHLVTTVKGGWMAAFVLFMLNGIVFAGAQAAIAVMSVRDGQD